MKFPKLMICLTLLGFGVVGNLKSQTATAKPISGQTGKTVHNPNIGMCGQAYDTLHYKQLANCPFTVLDNQSLKITSFEVDFSVEGGGMAEQKVSGNRMNSGFILDMKKGKATKLFLYSIKATDGKRTIDLGSTVFFVKCPNCW